MNQRKAFASKIKEINKLSKYREKIKIYLNRQI
jgi:hypothetical protein